MADEVKEVHVVGAGLAGTEIAYQLAEAGFLVHLYEMKPLHKTPAQTGVHFAELVCSNSFRSNNPSNAIGLLKEELRLCGAFIIRMADACRVPAGDALAVDREQFSAHVDGVIKQHPKIVVHTAQISQVPKERPVVIATGPLTHEPLAQDLMRMTDTRQFYFYDAIAPIVAADSLDLNIVFAQSRYDKGGSSDYLNCPMNKEEYFAFVEAVKGAEKMAFHEFEEARYFEGCLPIEVMVERGDRTLAFGPLKPVGLIDPRTGKQPYAVVQLRQENITKTAYNLVGFQTKMTYPEQKRVLRMIPGLAHAEFLRMGAIHRNTYVNAPVLLKDGIELHAVPGVFLAGQIVGVEGYLESSAHGFLVAQALIKMLKKEPLVWPAADTALGALWRHVTGALSTAQKEYGPENVHFGMFPSVDEPAPEINTKKPIKLSKEERKNRLVTRARQSIWPYIQAVKKNGRPQSDNLIQAITHARDAQIYVVDATQAVQQICQQLKAYPPACVHLGQAVMSALLLHAWSRFNHPGKVALEWKNEGPFGSLFAEASEQGRVRAMITYPQAAVYDYQTLLGPGLLRVFKQQALASTSFVTSKGDVAVDLVTYLEQSEQRSCGAGLAVKVEMNADESGFKITYARGYLLDVLPQSDLSLFQERLAHYDTHMQQLGPLSSWHLSQTQPLQDMLTLLCCEQNPTIEHCQPVLFYCPCSKTRAEAADALFRKIDPKENVESAQVRCEFCGKIYDLHIP